MDIRTRADIELLVSTFYEGVLKDEVLAQYFTGAKPVNFEKHLPRMFDYWENVLFHTGSYMGNPIFAHKLVHVRQQLHAEEFSRWIKLFLKTIDGLFTGPMATELKLRARNIAYIIEATVTGEAPDEQAYAGLLPE
jgi:hemoglobin